ncbi:MAG: spore coat protein [Chloroflexota bacterium]
MNDRTSSGLSDRDIAQDALTMHKHMTEIASTGCLEASSQSGLQAFEQLHRTELDHARRVYQLMNQRGWYQPQPAQTNMQQAFGQNQQGSIQQRQF